MTRTRSFLLALLSLGLPATGRADDGPLLDIAIDTAKIEQSLEEVVVLAAKRPQPIREAAASTSVITSADLAAFGWRSFQEAVASLAGFYLTESGDYSYVGVRGITQPGDFNGRILILVDGHAQQELWSNSAYPEGIGLDAAMIDHIEVLRGPASALYGTLGFLAIINIVTRRGTENEWARATFDMAMNDLRNPSGGAGLHFRGVGSVGHRFRNGLEFGVVANAFGSLGDRYTFPDLVVTGEDGKPTDHPDVCFPEIPSTCTHGVARPEVSTSKGFALFGHLDYKGLSVKASYQYWDKKIPYAPYRTLFNDPTNRYILSHGYLSLGYEAGRPSLLEAQARAYLDVAGYVDDLAYSDDGTAATRHVFHDEAHPWWSGTELKLLLERQPGGKIFVALTGGGEFIYFRGGHQSLYLDDPAGSVSRSVDQIFAAGYLQAEATWARKIFLTVGARYDYYGTLASTASPAIATAASGSAFSPRAGLVILPHHSTTFKLLYSHGFIRPSWYQLFYDDDISIYPNPRLAPQQLDDYELVYQQNLGRALSFTGSVFYLRGDQLIEGRAICVRRDPMDPRRVEVAADDPGPDCDEGHEARTQRENLSSFRSLGTELGLVGRFSGGTRFYLNYSYARASGPDGIRPFNSPEHMVKGGVSVPLWRDHLVVGAEARFWSARRLSPDAIDDADPYVLLSAHLAWKDLPKGFTAMVRVYDLTGLTWHEPSNAEDSYPIIRIPHQGPSLQLRLSYGF